MPRDHARVNLDIWGDDDWLDLTPPAQHLYFALWTDPGLILCGAGPWHPGRIAQRARGWSAASVERAAEECSERLFVLIDTDSEEYLLRSWIKHDGLWRTPNMAVSVANARATLASRILRGVIVHEVAKLRSKNKDSTSWKRDSVRNMLTQTAVDPASLDPFRAVTNSASNGASKGYANGASKGGGTHHLTVPPTVLANPTPNGGQTPTPTPTTGTTGGSTSRTTYLPQGETPPPRFCSKHPNGTDAPCGSCADARKAHDAWEAAADARQRAAHRATIDGCDWCDERGMRVEPSELRDHDWPAVRCDHTPWSAEEWRERFPEVVDA